LKRTLMNALTSSRFSSLWSFAPQLRVQRKLRRLGILLYVKAAAASRTNIPPSCYPVIRLKCARQLNECPLMEFRQNNRIGLLKLKRVKQASHWHEFCSRSDPQYGAPSRAILVVRSL